MTRRKPEHGGAPWYLMFTIVAAIVTGFVAYQVLHKRRLTAEAEAARAPKPVPKPVEPPPQPEPVPEAAEPPTPEESPPAEVASEELCDEVGCVLNNYEGACCAKYKKPRPSSGNGGMAESLDRSLISVGIDGVKARITACGDVSTATGKVKVKVRVSPDGSVSVVEVQTTPDPDLGACVAAAVRKARFAATQTGGSFSYPFVF
jgi:TonB family protein